MCALSQGPPLFSSARTGALVLAASLPRSRISRKAKALARHAFEARPRPHAWLWPVCAGLLSKIAGRHMFRAHSAASRCVVRPGCATATVFGAVARQAPGFLSLPMPRPKSGYRRVVHPQFPGPSLCRLVKARYWHGSWRGSHRTGAAGSPCNAPGGLGHRAPVASTLRELSVVSVALGIVSHASSARFDNSAWPQRTGILEHDLAADTPTDIGAAVA